MRSEHLVTHTTDEMLNSVPLYPELVIDQTGVGVPVADLLVARALEFRSVITTGGEKAHGEVHDPYGHWRESDHDDLVLATALACWRARLSDATEGLVRLMAGRRMLCGLGRVRSSSVGILRVVGSLSPMGW